MGFEIFMSPPNLTETQKELPVFREKKINFETGEEIIKDGDFVYLEKNEALQVWIAKTLLSERFAFKSYSDSLGVKLSDEIGKLYSRDVKDQVVFKDINDSLLVNPYILATSSYKSATQENGGKVYIDFVVSTIYGQMKAGTEVTYGN